MYFSNNNNKYINKIYSNTSNNCSKFSHTTQPTYSLKLTKIPLHTQLTNITRIPNFYLSTYIYTYLHMGNCVDSST